MVNPCPLPLHHWWELHPPVGTFIGILAGLGVIVPWLLRPLEGMKRTEKAIWTLVMFALVGLELRTLYLDRDEHDAEQAQARCQQLESFQKIADGIDRAISDGNAQYSATMGRMEGILMQQDKTLMQTMGGAAYPKFYPMPPLNHNDDLWPVLIIAPGTPWPHGHVPTSAEKAPLIDVTVDISEIPQPDFRTMTVSAEAFESQFLPQHYNLGTVMVPERRAAPFKLQAGKKYQLRITTRRRVPSRAHIFRSR